MRTNPTDSLAPPCDAPLLIRGLLDAALARSPLQEIVHANSERYTYREFGERINRLASVLTGLGVQFGETVAVMDWDTHRYLECYFAVPMMGAVLHTVNVRLSADQILYTINHAEDRVILVQSDFVPILEKIWSRIEPGKTLVLLSDGNRFPQSTLDFVGDYEGLLAESHGNFTFPNLDEHARATTFYTTGTTGLPKGVYFTQRQLMLHTIAVRNALAGKGQGRFNEEDVYMPITPMFHVHAWGLPYVATMLGVKQVYPGRYVSDHLLSLIVREAVSFSHCVPTVLHMLLKRSRETGACLVGWKVIIGGAALTHSLARQALDMGIDVFSGYGMSETCPIVALAQLDEHMLSWDLDRQAAVRCKTGRPIAMVNLRIVDAAMGDVPRDGTSMGEVVLRAPWLTAGYLKDESATQQLWHGGWLHTGDVAILDLSGYVKITDRLKDVIKTGGEWVSSLQIEDLIMRIPGVVEAAVIGIPDEKWTERPMAIVVLDPAGKGEECEIKRRLVEFAERGLVPRYGIPERIVAVDVIPKTSVGKVDKKSLRAIYGH